MSDRTITLADFYAVADHLPYGWKITLSADQEGADLELTSPEDHCADFDFGDTTIWSARNAVDVAREREGLDPIDWHEGDADGR